MRYISRLLLLLPLVFLFLFQNGVTSCTKDTIHIADTLVKRDTIVRTDTIVKKDTMLTTQILTSTIL